MKYQTRNKNIIPVILLMILLIQTGNAGAQGKVGINTSTPQAMLHVKDSSVLFSGDSSINPGNPPASGTGIRMMWYPDKAAFRVGGITIASLPNWDKDSIGYYSVAMGRDTRAKGEHALAVGVGSRATGNGSVALGIGAIASGFGSVAMGFGAQASGTGATALGQSSLASQNNATAMGNQTEASGFAASAFGNQSVASALGSTAMGVNTVASGDASTAMGFGTTASGFLAVAMGSATLANGDTSFALGSQTIASGDNAIASGVGTIASGNNSVTFGERSIAPGMNAVAMGFLSSASGKNAVAMGQSSAIGVHSMAMNRSIASGDAATSIGFNSTAFSYASFAGGQNNDPILTSSQTTWVSTDPLFILGNSTDINNTRNALIITKNAKTGINIANGLPQAMLHVKAAEAGNDRHIRLEAFNSTNNGNIFYNNDFNFRNNTAGGDFYFINNEGSSALSVSSSGTATVAGELNRIATGGANLVPVVYGSIAAAGTINTGTGNFTVTNSSTGVYNIAISGITYTTISSVTNVTPVAGNGVPRVATTSVSATNELLVRVYDLAGNLVNNAFHFIMFRP
jgi:Head domain of trimeric autotransporter adhesin